MEPTGRLDPTTEEAIRSLHDIVTPEPVSWMPQTWGWAVLGGALLVMLILVSIRRVLRYRANAYRREALHLLDGIETRIRNHATRQAAVHEVAEVLKRTALAGWGRGPTASLSGKEWSDFLEDKGDAEGKRLLGKLADDFEYRDPALMNRLPGNLADELANDARQWIEKHHV